MRVMDEPLHGVWLAMKRRCTNPNAVYYEDYGGRGITVCAEWSLSYATFRSWAEHSGYRQGLTLERINNDGDYSPENCRWATRSEQARNRRSNRELTAFGETKLMVDWCTDPRCMPSRLTLHRRLQLGWDVERALSTPVRRKASA